MSFFQSGVAITNPKSTWFCPVYPLRLKSNVTFSLNILSELKVISRSSELKTFLPLLRHYQFLNSTIIIYLGPITAVRLPFTFSHLNTKYMPLDIKTLLNKSMYELINTLIALPCYACQQA